MPFPTPDITYYFHADRTGGWNRDDITLTPESAGGRWDSPTYQWQTWTWDGTPPAWANIGSATGATYVVTPAMLQSLPAKADVGLYRRLQTETGNTMPSVVFAVGLADEAKRVKAGTGENEFQANEDGTRQGTLYRQKYTGDDLLEAEWGDPANQLPSLLKIHATSFDIPGSGPNQYGIVEWILEQAGEAYFEIVANALNETVHVDVGRQRDLEWSFNGRRVRDVGDPNAAKDAANRDYVDDEITSARNDLAIPITRYYGGTRIPTNDSSPNQESFLTYLVPVDFQGYAIAEYYRLLNGSTQGYARRRFLIRRPGSGTPVMTAGVNEQSEEGGTGINLRRIVSGGGNVEFTADDLVSPDTGADCWCVTIVGSPFA